MYVLIISSSKNNYLICVINLSINYNYYFVINQIFTNKFSLFEGVKGEGDNLFLKVTRTETRWHNCQPLCLFQCSLSFE